MELKELIAKLGLTDNADAETLINDFADDYAKMRSESIEKSMQQRINKYNREANEEKARASDLAAQLDALNDQKDKLTNEIKQYSEYKQKYEEQRKDLTAKAKAKLDNYLKQLEVEETDKFFDKANKIKSRLELKENADEYTPELLEKNLEILEIYKDAGMLVDSQPAQPTESPISYPERKDTKFQRSSGGVVSQAVAKLSKR